MLICATEVSLPKNAASNYNDDVMRFGNPHRFCMLDFDGLPVPAKFGWHLGDSSTKVLFGYPMVPRTLVLHGATHS